MKRLSPKVRRELLFVSGATLVVLIPLFALWLKSVIARANERAAMRTAITQPTISISHSASLSPDGQWFARMEPPAALVGKPYKQGMMMPKDELVIRSVQNDSEVFRAQKVGSFVGWGSNSKFFVTQDLGDIHVFTPLNASSKGLIVTPAWKQKQISFSIPPDDISMGSNGSMLEAESGAIVFSPDFRFAVKGIWDSGTIVWDVADLQTGKMTTGIKAGRWLGFDPRTGGFEREISVAVAPASLASGGRPLVAVLQTADLATQKRLAPTPVPTSTATPIPAPTATYTPVQKQVLAKEEKESDDIQKLVESVLGVDGADPEVTDDAQVKRIDAEVKRRNKALDAERLHFFPHPPWPTPKPTPKYDPWSLTKPYQVQCFDLSTRKNIWTAPIKVDMFLPKMRFSPDGSSLVTWATAAAYGSGKELGVDNRGLEFRAARTGHLTSKTTLFQKRFDFDVPITFYEEAPNRPHGAPRSILAVTDSYTGRSVKGKFDPYKEGDVVRFFTAFDGHEVGFLKLDGPSVPERFNSFSIAQGGQTWLFNEDNSDVSVLDRSDIGADATGPFPLPTPRPTYVSKR